MLALTPRIPFTNSVSSPACSSARAVQVVDDRQEVPDDGGAGVLAELLVLALRSLAEVVEVRLQPAGHVQVLVRLGLRVRELLLETDLRLLHIFRLISHW